MANKEGFIEKVKVCWFWLTNSTRKHVLTVSCEFCDSTNIVARDKVFADGQGEKIYTAKYKYLSCMATCKVSQEWSK